MKAIIMREYGGPEVLQLEEAEKPEAAADGVLIKVDSAGINYADVARRKNAYLERTPLPYTPGLEAAGTVEAVGTDVIGFKAGDRVLAFTNGGGYAEYVSVNFRQISPIPEKISFAESTALLVQGMTALGLLNDAVSGQTILVHAAAGGVGSILVQLAKLKGLRVIGTASSTEKLEKVLSMGADAAVNYSENDWPDEVLKANNGKGVDIVIEMVGGEIVARNLEVLGVNGTMLVYGSASGENYPLPILNLLQKNTTIRGYWLSLEPTERRAAFAAELADHVASERIKIAITEYPLEKAADAHRALEGRRTTGKIVLKVS